MLSVLWFNQHHQFLERILQSRIYYTTMLCIELTVRPHTLSLASLTPRPLIGYHRLNIRPSTPTTTRHPPRRHQRPPI